jgi:hypothetical protein
VFWFTGTGGTDSYSVRINGTVEDRAGDLYAITGNNKYTLKGLCCFDWIAAEDEDYRVMSMIETLKIHPIGN